MSLSGREERGVVMEAAMLVGVDEWTLLGCVHFNGVRREGVWCMEGGNGLKQLVYNLLTHGAM